MSLAAYIRSRPYLCLCGTFALAGVAWELAARSGVINTRIWSYPSDIGQALWEDLTSPGAEFGDQNVRTRLPVHIGKTLLRFSAGFGIASLIGVTVGFLLSVSRTLQAVCHPVVNVLRSLPSAAIWPIAAAVLGYGLNSQMFVVIFGTTWPILVYTTKGVGALRNEVYDSLHFMWLEWYRRWWVLFLWSLPSIITGLEVGCAIAFLLTVTVEFFFPASGGLGWYLDYYRQGGTEADRLFAGLVLIGLLGWASNTLVHLLRRRFIYWEGTLAEIIRQESPKRRAKILDLVREERRRTILQAQYLTRAVEHLYHTSVEPAVHYQGVPYMYPNEVEHHLEHVPFAPGLLQRDITISVPAENGDGRRPIVFARSWIVEDALSPVALAKVYEKKLTIGTIMHEFQKHIVHQHLWYKERISDKLGTVLAAGGTVHVVERGRLILVGKRPAIYIEECVPI